MYIVYYTVKDVYPAQGTYRFSGVAAFGLEGSSSIRWTESGEEIVKNMRRQEMNRSGAVGEVMIGVMYIYAYHRYINQGGSDFTPIPASPFKSLLQ